ncbi:LINE-1 type transposase domain containing protein 1 [Dissostichus eleginoides]|uniref:LINE-1 type transposase domain containing protein 1 n=1 Tax=Dissostichus eleginoides TaxID=100907 RepID=A0AAD9BN15_DISEL|nr:LINE-1 type transposase domain containing protein 1 [Dissostichus eleginoides]
MPKSQLKKSNHDKVPGKHAVNNKPLVEESGASGCASFSQRDTKGQREEGNMANLDVILQELREFRQENSEQLRDIREDINKTKNRIDEAEERIAEAEERLESVEGAVSELLKLQTHMEARLTDQEGRSRRDNIRIHGVCEGAEENSPSVIYFVETLLKENLDLPPFSDLKIERAHQALGTKPPADAPPRSIVVKFASHRTKEEIIKTAWQKQGFVYQERKVNLDHDYSPEVLKKRKEYVEAKRVLREKNIRFQTPFPAKLRVFFQDGTRIYGSAEEATKDMAAKGLPVVFKPPETWVERIKRLSWSAVSRGRETETPASRTGFKEKLETFRRSERL